MAECKLECDLNYDEDSTTDFGLDNTRLFGYVAATYGSSAPSIDGLFPNLKGLRLQVDFAMDDLSTVAFSGNNLRPSHISGQLQKVIERSFAELRWRRPVDIWMVLTDMVASRIIDEGADISQLNDVVLQGNTLFEQMGKVQFLGTVPAWTESEEVGVEGADGEHA